MHYQLVNASFYKVTVQFIPVEGLVSKLGYVLGKWLVKRVLIWCTFGQCSG